MRIVVEVYRDRAGEHRWRAKAENNRIVATSGEGYRDEADCRRMADVLFVQENHVEVVDGEHEEQYPAADAAGTPGAEGSHE